MGTESSSVFLMENLAVQCYSQDHWLMVLTLGLPLLLMYVRTFLIKISTSPVIASSSTSLTSRLFVFFFCVRYVIGIPVGIYHILSKPSARRMISQIAHADSIARTASIDDKQTIVEAQKARHQLSFKTQAFSTSYAFLFLGYKSELYLWEIVVLARKGCLSLIGVAFSRDPRTQVIIIL